MTSYLMCGRLKLRGEVAMLALGLNLKEPPICRGQARQGGAWHGRAWLGAARHGVARRGRAGLGEAGQGKGSIE